MEILRALVPGYDNGYVAYCYPEQGMTDRLLRVYMQSPSGLWAWVTLCYNRH